MQNSAIGFFATVIFSLFFFFGTFYGLGSDSTAFAQTPGLLQTVWSCDIPCTDGNTGDYLSSIHVTYCSVSALSPGMFNTLTPECRKKTGDPEARAVRSSPAGQATCASSSNTCPREGLTEAGYTCRFLCPSQENLIRKFTACATTSEEAWSYAKQICPDAVPPSPSFFSPSKICEADGQTSCQ